jgi:hypothetical protein
LSFPFEHQRIIVDGSNFKLAVYFGEEFFEEVMQSNELGIVVEGVVFIGDGGNLNRLYDYMRWARKE